MTKKQSIDSDQGQYTPGNPLEKLYEDMQSGGLASGRTVNERAPSDTTELQATFPQGRPPSARKRHGLSSKSTALPVLPPVRIGVEWGHEVHTITMPASRWADIMQGTDDVAESTGAYEGTTFNITWQFNGLRPGSLVVSYGEDGADGFIGSIGDASVTGAAP